MASRRTLPEVKLPRGQHVVVAEDVEAQYEDIARRILTITAVYDHEGEEEGASPCFDETMESYLYEFQEIDTALYGVELTPVNVSLPKHPRLYHTGQTIYLRSGESPLTIVALIEPRLPENHRPTAPAYPAGIPWEYLIEGIFSEQEQQLHELTPDAQGKCRMAVSEGLLTETPPVRPRQKRRSSAKRLT
jgi:hypothetical protein